MKSKIISVILLFLLWSFGSGWYYVCEIKGLCENSIEQNNGAVNKGVSFEFSSAEPQLGTGFESYKASLIDKLDSTNRMRITGLYSPSEVNSSGFDNLGIARALAIQNLFSELSQDRFDISSREEGLDKSQKSIDAVEFRVMRKNSFVEEKEYGAVLHPDFSSDSLESKIVAYLNFIANENNENQIDIVGHTDDSNTEGENFNIGLVQANRIMDKLIELGMSAHNLNPSSKGETEPIAGNGTDEGKSMNNRVEILIN